MRSEHDDGDRNGVQILLEGQISADSDEDVETLQEQATLRS
jgi:hypothetical protein